MLRGACCGIVVAFAAAAHAEDQELPRGALARLDAARHPSLAVDAGDDEPPPPGVALAALTADGSAAILARQAGPLGIWDVRSGDVRRLPVRHEGDLSALAASPDGDRFATGDDEGRVHLWSAAAGRTLALSIGKTRFHRVALALSPDGSRLAASSGASVVLWKVADGSRFAIERPAEKERAVVALAWTADGAGVACLRADGDLTLEGLAGSTQRTVRKAAAASPRALCAAPDGSAFLLVEETALALVGADGAETARRAGAFPCAALAPATRLAAAGDPQGRLHLLDAESLADVAVVDGHASAVRALAFSADGRRLVTAGDDGVAIVWDVAAVLGREPERVERPPLSTDEPSPPPRYRFPPAKLRVAKVEGLRDRESVEPYPGLLPGTTAGDDDVRAVLVLDAVTGAPLAGATVRLFEEELVGPPGPPLDVATTDSFGLAYVVWVPGRAGDQWLVEAPGRAPVHEFGWESPEEVVFLRTAADAVGRLLDPYGRPLAGAAVELFFGCGHGPTARRATSEADGTFRLPACDPRDGNLVVYAPGCSAEYLDGAAFGKFGATPTTFVLRPGVDLAGRVVGADGWPMAHVGVASETVERTRTLTDASGEFVLRGLAPTDAVRVVGPYHETAVIQTFDAPRWNDPETRVELRVGVVEEQPGVDLAVRLVDDATGQPVETAEWTGAMLVDPRTGMRHDATVDDEGRLVFVASPGEYLLVPGGAFDAYRGASESVRLTGGDPSEHVVRVAPQPGARVRMDSTVQAVTRLHDDDRVVALGSEARSGEGPLHLPADGPAALVSRSDDRPHRAIAFGPALDGVREADLRAEETPPRTIRVKGLPARIASSSTDFATRSLVLDGEDWVCETDATGALRLRFRSDDGAIWVAEVVLPDDPGACVETTARRLTARRVRLSGPDGAPLSGIRTYVSVQDEDGVEHGSHGETDRDGAYEADAPESQGLDALVTVEPDGWVPRRAPLLPDRDAALAWGDVTLVVEVTDEDDDALDAVLWVDGFLAEVDDGRATLRGLDAGERFVLVGADQRQAQRLAVDLRAGETRTIRVALPELPE